MRFRVLGTLDVSGGEATYAPPLRSAKLRRLLAALLLEADGVVSVSRLADILWRDDPPADPARAVHTLVSRLRSWLRAIEPLGEAHLLTRPPGYTLRVERDQLDALHFEDLLTAARGMLNESPESAGRLLDEALELWRGPAYAEFTDEEFARAEAGRLEELRLTAIEERFDAALALGQHHEVVGRLGALVAAQPLRERPLGQLMLALYRSGRAVDALEAYRAYRTGLKEELGLEPSPALVRLEAAVLRQDSGLEAPQLPAPLERGQPQASLRATPVSEKEGQPPGSLAQPRQPLMVGSNEDLAGVVASVPSRRLGSLAGHEGERRTVTVVFVDAVASTALAERLDEEDVCYLMEGAIARMMEAVHRYEGAVTQFVGDGIIALFGAPRAHEDSARRAVSAALDMREALEAYGEEAQRQYGDSLVFRIGMNTGPVVVSSISDDLEMDLTAIGDTINLAARMQHEADAGEILVSERTWLVVQDYFDFQDAGLQEVKGHAAPVRAYRPLRSRPVRTRIEAAAERGLTRFVGREHELSVLGGYLGEVVRGEGQVVFVAGEAGMGKTRLLLEFRHSVGEEVGWLEGHCISYGRAIPYLPIREIVRQSFGVEESDDEAHLLRRVEERTSAWDERAEALVPYLKYLLNVDPGTAVVRMDPRERQAGIFDALRTLLLLESRQRPLVVLVEDLHWVDDKTEQALGALIDVVAGAQVLLVLTYRPGHSPSLGERTYFSRLTLGRLPQEETASMAQALLGAEALPAELVALVNTKAEGNPFYTEEVTKSLLESGVLHRRDGSFELARPVEELRLPTTIQEVILSRIDRLQGAAREALQLGSVIGREFTGRLLARISNLDSKLDEALNELKRLDLVYQKGYFPEHSYMFKHALTHDVAYSTLLRERRRGVHRRVGAAIEELYPDRLAEQVETLAHHYSEGEAWDKALDYLVKAGDKAAGAYANKEALDYYQRALDVCDRLGETRTTAAVAERRGHVNLTIGDVGASVEDFERMRDAATQFGDRRLEGRALALRGLVEHYAHDFESCEETLRAALAIGDESFDDVRLLASVMLFELLMVLNRHFEAEAFARAAAELVEEVDEPYARALWSMMALRPHWAGHFDKALAHLERWRWAAEASGSATVVLGNDWVEGLVRGARGDYGGALALVHRVVQEAERIGEVLFWARAVNTLGWVYGELQDHERALEWSRRGVEVALRIEAPNYEIEGNARLNLGDALMALGRLDEAEEQYAAVERVARDPAPPDRYMLWRYSQHLFHSYGELWLARGDTDKALAYADECLALAIQSDSRKNIVKGRRLRGEALLAQGRLADVEQELATALGVTQQVGNPPQLWKTYAALARLRLALGQTDEARDAYRKALAVIEGVAAGLQDEKLATILLDSQQTQAIRHSLQAVAT